MRLLTHVPPRSRAFFPLLLALSLVTAGAAAQDIGAPTIRVVPAPFSRSDIAAQVYNDTATLLGMQALSQTVDLSGLIAVNPCPPGSLCHAEQEDAIEAITSQPLREQPGFEGTWTNSPLR